MNTKYINTLGIALFSTLLFAGCTKDIDVDLPDYPPQLAIYSTVAKGDVLNALTGRSISILKYNGRQDLNEYNAKIDIYIDGVFTETMVYDNIGNPFEPSPYLTSNTIIEHGKTYTIKASAPGYSMVAEATATVPPQVVITDVKRVVNARQLNGSKDEITITFNDPGNTKDYYTVEINSGYFDSLLGPYGEYICITSTDPSIEKTANSDIIPIAGEDDCLFGEIFFRDDLFNGTAKQIKFYVPTGQMEPAIDMNGDLVYPTVTLRHVSEDYLRYRKTAEFAQNNQGNPFAEPANVYSNVKNGVGIFTISSQDTKEIR